MNKKNLSESDICDKFIRPAIEAAGWNGLEQIPPPPLEEMNHIVARVELLRRLCADLHQRLAQSQTTQAALTEALVAAE